MADSAAAGFNSRMESIRHWIVDNKLRTVGSLWASGIAGSLAYNWSRPTKTSVKIIHARLHAQALTLAALVGAAAVEYYDKRGNDKPANDRYARLIPVDASYSSQRD